MSHIFRINMKMDYRTDEPYDSYIVFSVEYQNGTEKYYINPTFPSIQRVFRLLEKTHTKEYQYRQEIGSWDWEAIRQECQDNLEDDIESCSIPPYPKRGSSYLGSVLDIMPSGKFYTCWTTNQSDKDVEEDSLFQEILEEVAEKYGLSIENGEGDPCDLFAVLYTDDGDSDGYVL